MTMAVLGGNEFVVGFQLAGIRQAFEAKGSLMDRIKEIKSNPSIKIVVMDENLLNGLDRQDRLDIEASVAPVFVPLSTSSSQENLRFLIKKSIGIDIMAQ